MIPKNFVNRILKGDCLELLKRLPSHSVDLIMTSPPYADNRKKTYKGIRASEYVEWFLPISAQLYRVLRPDGSFILNVKERVINGERGIYIYELVLKNEKTRMALDRRIHMAQEEYNARKVAQSIQRPMGTLLSFYKK